MCDLGLSALPLPRRAWYMWTDAWNDSAARRNPLRWRRVVSMRELVRRLAVQSISRPLRIFLKMEGGKLERDFVSPESAVLWLRSKFECEVEATRVRTSSGLGSARPCNDSSRSADEELMNIRATALQMNQPMNTAPPEPLDGTLCQTPQIDSDNVCAHAVHINDEQACVATLKYMWADAGVLPTKFTQSLAEANPIRWSSAMAPGELIKHLVSMPSIDRPVKLWADMPGHREMKTFDNANAAVQWVRAVFKNCLDAEAEVSNEHKCVVCLDAQVSVMLMPCRHAVLCDDCAGRILTGSRSCPVCREAISEHARGSYADDYVDIVQALETRMQRTQAAAYDGMYNGIRPMMITGALLATGAAACFVLAPPAAPALAGAAFAVGYLPWFATTVQRFENEDRDQLNQVAPTRFFTQEDLSRPLTLIAKTLTMAVVAPCAAIVFFVPYGLYAGVARPLAKALMQGLVRVSAFAHVYALRPTLRALQNLSHSLLNLLRSVGRGACESARILGDLLVAAARNTGDFLTGVANGIARGASMVWQGTVRTLHMIGHGIAVSAEFLYRNALVPVGRGILMTLAATGYGAWMALQALGNFSVTCVTNLYSYIILPSGRAMVIVFRRCGEGVANGARALYNYVLVPTANGIACGASMLWQGTVRTLQMIGHGIAVSAEFLYRNALVPVGRGIRATPAAAYQHILIPTGQAIACAASSVYVYVFQPCGRVLYAMGAITTRALQAVAHQCRVGAQNVYVYVIQPSGDAIYVVVVASGNAVRACGREVRHAARSACSNVHATAVASGSAMRACGQEVGHAARSACSNVHAAAVASGSAMRAWGHEVRDAARSTCGNVQRVVQGRPA